MVAPALGLLGLMLGRGALQGASSENFGQGFKQGLLEVLGGPSELQRMQVEELKRQQGLKEKLGGLLGQSTEPTPFQPEMFPGETPIQGKLMNAPQITPEEKHRQAMAMFAQMDPAAFMKGMGFGSERPSNIREWDVFNSMTPEEQEQYLTMKRASQFSDLGGSIVRQSQIPGSAPVYSQPKTVSPDQQPELKGAQAEASAAGKIYGENIAQKNVDYPKVKEQADAAITLLNDLKKHPGLSYAVGKTSVMPIFPGTDAADFMTRLKQIEGKQFMAAYETLKGGGQITEVEGKKATQALARLDRAQTEDAFKDAIEELSKIIEMGLDRAKNGVIVDNPVVTNTGRVRRYNPETGEIE